VKGFRESFFNDNSGAKAPAGRISKSSLTLRVWVLGIDSGSDVAVIVDKVVLESKDGSVVPAPPDASLSPASFSFIISWVLLVHAEGQGLASRLFSIEACWGTACGKACFSALRGIL
jgi:hypothetical protein